MSSSSLANYLSGEEKTRLALRLAQELHTSADAPAVLAGLVSQLESGVLHQVHGPVLQFVLGAIDQNDECRFARAAAFVAAIPALSGAVVEAVMGKLKALLGSKYNFVAGFEAFTAPHRAGGAAEPRASADDAAASLDLQARKALLGIFGFLTKVYTAQMDSASWDAADALLCLFLGHRDDNVALECSKLLRWRADRVVDQCMADERSARHYWDLVFALEKSAESRRHRCNAFVMWLRMLNSPRARFENDVFIQDELLGREFYWAVLQSGLGASSHEVRKYCLSILQLSLKAVRRSFSNGLISWDTAREPQLLKEWSRFTTLYEVLGVDTSLHQTQAAVHDILAIITPGSLVPASWGFCLLSTGFQASMDSVRRYSAHILFSIAPENLHLLQHGLPYLENHFLPYMMLSRHFAVRPTSGTSNEMVCEYGDQFSRFICSVMAHLETPEEYGRVTASILAVLAKARESFDAVRVYAMVGILEGLGSRLVLQYGVHDVYLLQLFEDFSEGELFRKTVQTLNLRLLLNFQLKSLADFGALLAKFNSFNGHTIFSEHLAAICTYLTVSGVGQNDVLQQLEQTASAEEQVVYTRIACALAATDTASLEKAVSAASTLTFAKLLESGLHLGSSWFEAKTQAVFGEAEMGDASEDVYHILSQCVLDKVPPLDLGVLWSKIRAGLVSDDYGTLTSTYARMRFVCKCLETGGVVLQTDVPQLLALHPQVCSNSAACAKTVSNFYRLKENMFGEFFRLVCAHVQQKGISLDEFQQLAGVLPQDSVHFVTAVSVAKIFQHALSSRVLDTRTCEVLAEQLGGTVKELAGNLKLAEKEMHWVLIEALLHEELLAAALESPAVDSHIGAAAEALLAAGYGRRGILTKMFEALARFQTKRPEKFEQLRFLPRLLVDAMVQRELKTSAFRLEEIIGTLYDTRVSPVQSQLYLEVYGEREISYRVTLMAMLNSLRSSVCADAIFAAIFDEDRHNLRNIRKAMDGEEERVRVQLAKVVVSLMDVVSCASARGFYDQLEHFVETDPSPLVRAYFEWALALHLLKHPALSEALFRKLESALDSHELKPILVTCYERVLFLMIQAMGRADKTRYLTKLITIIVPAASTNKAVTRHFSMSLAMSVHSEIEKSGLQIDANLHAVVANMNRSALATDAFGQFRSGDACLWHIVDDRDLVHLSGGLLLRLFDREVEFLTQSDFDRYLSAAQRSRLARPVGRNREDLWVRRMKSTAAALSEASGTVAALQTKSGAWSSVVDVDDKARVGDIRRSELVVVASLVDKAPNLGGICRLCDVLGAGLLTVHDLAVKNHQSFRSVAVTADHWMPMAEVRPEAVVAFMREKKRDGYKLIGLEQTDKSVVLDSALRFPARSVILLGREKEGIPGELLAELDQCVEIRQVGVVRSMNIQTATAVIVHAYAAQHC